MDPRSPKEKHTQLIDIVILFLQQNALIQLHYFVYLLPLKCEHQRQYSKMSDISIDEENEVKMRDVSGANIGLAGSEHSNDTENTEQNISTVYDEYREILNEYNVSEKNQQYIFKAFEQKTEQDIKLFMQ